MANPNRRLTKAERRWYERHGQYLEPGSTISQVDPGLKQYHDYRHGSAQSPELHQYAEQKLNERMQKQAEQEANRKAAEKAKTQPPKSVQAQPPQTPKPKVTGAATGRSSYVMTSIGPVSRKFAELAETKGATSRKGLSVQESYEAAEANKEFAERQTRFFFGIQTPQDIIYRQQSFSGVFKPTTAELQSRGYQQELRKYEQEVQEFNVKAETPATSEKEYDLMVQQKERLDKSAARLKKTYSWSQEEAKITITPAGYRLKAKKSWENLVPSIKQEFKDFGTHALTTGTFTFGFGTAYQVAKLGMVKLLPAKAVAGFSAIGPAAGTVAGGMLVGIMGARGAETITPAIWGYSSKYLPDSWVENIEASYKKQEDQDLPPTFLSLLHSKANFLFKYTPQEQKLERYMLAKYGAAPTVTMPDFAEWSGDIVGIYAGAKLSVWATKPIRGKTQIEITAKKLEAAGATKSEIATYRTYTDVGMKQRGLKPKPGEMDFGTQKKLLSGEQEMVFKEFVKKENVIVTGSKVYDPALKNVYPRGSFRPSGDIDLIAKNVKVVGHKAFIELSHATPTPLKIKAIHTAGSKITEFSWSGNELVTTKTFSFGARQPRVMDSYTIYVKKGEDWFKTIEFHTKKWYSEFYFSRFPVKSVEGIKMTPTGEQQMRNIFRGFGIGQDGVSFYPKDVMRVNLAAEKHFTLQKGKILGSWSPFKVSKLVNINQLQTGFSQVKIPTYVKGDVVFAKGVWQSFVPGFNNIVPIAKIATPQYAKIKNPSISLSYSPSSKFISGTYSPVQVSSPYSAVKLKSLRYTPYQPIKKGYKGYIPIKLKPYSGYAYDKIKGYSYQPYKPYKYSYQPYKPINTFYTPPPFWFPGAGMGKSFLKRGKKIKGFRRKRYTHTLIGLEKGLRATRTKGLFSGAEIRGITPNIAKFRSKIIKLSMGARI